jgi:hypothetical protein
MRSLRSFQTIFPYSCVRAQETPDLAAQRRGMARARRTEVDIGGASVGEQRVVKRFGIPADWGSPNRYPVSWSGLAGDLNAIRSIEAA